MAYTGDKYIGDLALYYIAKKLESGKETGSVKDVISQRDIDKQLKGDYTGAEPTAGATIGLSYYQPGDKATVFNQDEISAAMNIADNLIKTSLPVAKSEKNGFTEKDLYIVAEEILSSKSNIGQDLTPPKAATGEYERKQFQEGLNQVMEDSIQMTLRGSGEQERNTFLNALGYDDISQGPGMIPPPPGGETPPGETPPPGDETLGGETPPPGDEPPGDVPPPGGPEVPPPGEQTLNPNKNQFNNIPDGADLVDVEGQLFLRYAVPGAGELYQGSTIFMFYEVRYNDPVEAGFVTPGQDWFVNAKFSYDDLDLMGVIAGNSADLPGNDPVTGKAPHPFTSFAENLATEAQIAPWILDPDSVALIAEAALEGREVTEAEWFSTNWYKTHNESERSWLREYTKDPLTAKQKANDYKLQVAAALKAAGVSGGYDSETNQELGAPDALSSYIANKWVSGQWSESYTTEQLALFADPFRTGVRDQDFTDWIDTAGVGGLNRTAEQEDRIRNLYTQWLGPVFGQLTDSELAEKAGRLRNNPDYEAALIENLKTSRLALFPKYTNTELTYDDIVAPWRGMTRQVWGKEADETEGWWQDMVATNDYEAGQTTLREKGLEQNIGQVTVAATQALQQALGASAGSVEENLGVNQ